MTERVEILWVAQWWTTERGGEWVTSHSGHLDRDAAIDYVNKTRHTTHKWRIVPV